ncbi:tetratricopeptide repeat protein [Serratia silvae]|uniref:Sel1 repeat family protein n=1 Tax=Serratia silvae TaxID=2824122 RepID=A0ABT0K8Z2_9GAMM|nr:tetratricopeptide repeat protein [Serratia silvae]MCL1028509.1 sel1 repeat family protein [Serratia silvae]
MRLTKVLAALVVFSALAGCDSSNTAKLLEGAEKGDVKSQLALSTAYSVGRSDLKKDPAEALKWLTEAAENGNSEAQYSLAVKYFVGRGDVIQSYSKAAYWYERALMSGNEEALYPIAINYQVGFGVEKDIVKAYAYLLVAQSKGYKIAIDDDAKFTSRMTLSEREAASKMAEEINDKYLRKDK